MPILFMMIWILMTAYERRSNIHKQGITMWAIIQIQIIIMWKLWNHRYLFNGFFIYRCEEHRAPKNYSSKETQKLLLRYENDWFRRADFINAIWIAHSRTVQKRNNIFSGQKMFIKSILSSIVHGGCVSEV